MLDKFKEIKDKQLEFLNFKRNHSTISNYSLKNNVKIKAPSFENDILSFYITNNKIKNTPFLFSIKRENTNYFVSCKSIAFNSKINEYIDNIQNRTNNNIDLVKNKEECKKLHNLNKELLATEPLNLNELLKLETNVLVDENLKDLLVSTFKYISESQIDIYNYYQNEYNKNIQFKKEVTEKENIFLEKQNDFYSSVIKYVENKIKLWDNIEEIEDLISNSNNNKPIKFDILHTDILNIIKTLDKMEEEFILFNHSKIKITFTKKRTNYYINEKRVNKEILVKLLKKRVLLNNKFMEKSEIAKNFTNHYINLNSLLKIIN